MKNFFTKTFLSLYFLALMAFSLFSQEKIQDLGVNCELVTKASKLHAGLSNEIFLVFHIKDGWYLYDSIHEENAPKIKWNLPVGIGIKKECWSKPVVKTIFDEKTQVHQKILVIKFIVTSETDIDIKDSISADVSWITCNESSCQPDQEKVTLLVENDQNKIKKFLDLTNYKCQVINYYEILTVIIFAILGGVILNLMPCVLPVLSLKILSLTKNHDKKSLRKNGIFFTLGTVSSFLIVAVVLDILKSLGHEIGWGFQLQSPIFVLCLANIFFLIAMNLFGVFEIGTKLGNISGLIANDKSAFNSFLHGVLACLVATPCTAPFMGTALGVALTQPWFVSNLIFLSLGLGMALPFLLISFVPNLSKFLPKPNKWMTYFKQFLGFCMLASVLWLMEILAHQTNDTVFSSALLGMLIIGLGCWLLGISRNFSLKTLSYILIILGFLFGEFKIWLNENVQVEKNNWVAYDPKVLDELKKQGKIVFIDFTAKWCITCQFNKKIVLESDKIINSFSENKVVTMKADWTNKDATITKALSDYGRNSVPLYVIHFGHKKTVVLSEIITEQDILKVFRENKELLQDDSKNTGI